MSLRWRGFAVRVMASAAVFCAVYGVMYALQHSRWNKERIYKQLFSPERAVRERAAEDLVYYRAQAYLLRALKTDTPPARDAASDALSRMWYRAAGAEGYRMIEAAQTAMSEQKFSEALTILNRLVERYPGFAEGLNRRAILYWMIGEYDLAIADCEAVVELNPEHFGAWQGLGSCHFRRGDFQEAHRAYEAALRIVPFDEAARKALQRCKEMLRQAPPRSTKPGELASTGRA
jgi:tetratricopeptide (TPR) repeat protein